MALMKGCKESSACLIFKRRNSFLWLQFSPLIWRISIKSVMVDAVALIASSFAILEGRSQLCVKNEQHLLWQVESDSRVWIIELIRVILILSITFSLDILFLTQSISIAENKLLRSETRSAIPESGISRGNGGCLTCWRLLKERYECGILRVKRRMLVC